MSAPKIVFEDGVKAPGSTAASGSTTAPKIVFENGIKVPESTAATSSAPPSLTGTRTGTTPLVTLPNVSAMPGAGLGPAPAEGASAGDGPAGVRPLQGTATPLARSAALVGGSLYDKSTGGDAGSRYLNSAFGLRQQINAINSEIESLKQAESLEREQIRQSESSASSGQDRLGAFQAREQAFAAVAGLEDTQQATREKLAAELGVDLEESPKTDRTSYADVMAELISKRDALTNQYYHAENQEQRAKLRKDTALSGQYTSARDIRSDLETIADLRSALAEGKTGASVREAQAYLMEKYGLDESAAKSWQDANYTDILMGTPGEGYRTLGELYAALEEQQKQAAETLREGGYDYTRMAGYEQMEKDREEAARKQEQWARMAREDPVGASFASVLFSPLQGADYLKTMASGIGHSDANDLKNYVPMNTYNMDVTNMVSTVRGTVSQEIEENTNWEIFGQNVASFLYQTGMSVADSAVQVGTMGSWATMVMGASAASNQAKDIIERGGTNSQAFWGGLAAGAAEAVFEKVSIDKLLSAKNVTGIKSLLKETAKQAGVEASEEVFTEIANIISDAVIMGNNSSYANAVKQYIAQGMSEEQAKRKAFLDCVGQVTLAGAGGALSGAAMGGAVSGINYSTVGQGAVNRSARKLGNEFQGMGQDVVQAIIQEGLDSDPSTQSYKLAAELQQKLASGQTITARELGRLYQENVQTVAQEERAQTTARAPVQASAAQNTAGQNAAPTGVQAQNNTASTGEADVSLVQRVRQSIPQMQNAAPVATVTGNELPQGNRIVDRLTQFVNAIGNKVNRPGFGDVLFSKGRIKNSVIGHGVGQAKIETFAAVPAVIRNGAQIDHQENWKGRGYDTYTFAAPVTYQGQRTYLGVIVTRDTQDGRYYVHEVVDESGNIIFENKENTEAASDGRASLSGTVDTVATSVSDHTVPQPAQGVKDQSAPNSGVVSISGSGLETDQTQTANLEEPPVIERGAAEEPPTMTGGMDHGKQPQRTIAGDRAADGGTVEANLSDRGQGRLSDESSGGQAGVLADSAEGARRRSAEQGRTAVGRQNRTKALQQERVSSRSLGIQQGTDSQSLTVVPEEAWDHEMQATAERVWNEAGKEVTYVLGRIQLQGSDGELHYVRGVYSQNGIILQADNMRLSIDQIADHEIFHDKARRSPGLVSQIEARITEKYGENELRGIVETYVRKLRGVIDVSENASQFEMDDALLDVLEEIFADAYAGINAFSAHAERFDETVEQAMDERGIGRGTQTAKDTEQTTGPPERYSVDEEREKKSKRKPAVESKPIIAKNDLRKNMMGLFSIPEGQRLELGKVVDQFADRLLKSGELTEADRAAFFDRMYESGVVNVPADEYYQAGRQIVKGGKVYVNEQVRAEFGDDWNEFRKRAFSAGVYLTGAQSDSGVDVWNAELSEMLPGHFQADDTDSRGILERIVQLAEEGKDEKVSLAEYTTMLAEQEYIPEDEFLSNMERQMDWALRTFAEKARLEIKLRDRTGIKLAQEREQRREAMQRQRENRELRELQQRTLKQLQWLSKNRYKAPKELKAAWDEVLGDIDVYAVNAANEMNWSKKYQATWKDLAEMYKDAEQNDPNFMRSKELERVVARLDNEKIGDMDISALQDLYKAAVGIRTEFYNRNNVINDEMGRMFSEVYADAKEEIGGAQGGYRGGKVDKFMNLEQLTPMNVLERMGGWNPNGTFYSMAKQLEQGERAVRDYAVRAKRTLEDFLTENQEWAKKADGQGKDAIWYELEVPELQELRMGDKPVFGDTVKVYMTPSQKVHLYLESKSEDNLRHMMGGRTFADKELYSQGKRAEALAQGKTVKLAPETVKKIVSDLTQEELALAQVLESYYNGFASERINKVSNTLYGYDKAVSQNYAPIYTNQNYTKSELGVFDVTAEGVGNLKPRQYAKNPSYNISAFDAFERHVDKTARFVGMAIPARNWNTLLNWRENGNSTGDVITHKWGQEGKAYIEDLLVELQGGKEISQHSVAESLMDTALNGYISSVFGFNPSIVFKQAMSFPLAGTYLGWENMPVNIAKALTVDDRLINAYTSELAYRLMGYSTPETAQLKANPSKLDQNKALNFVFRGGAITAMDGWTVKTIWSWAENRVRRINPDLEVGTQEQIDGGNSPFYQAVAREFEEAVSRSQPMYDVMHRSQIMRSSNKAVRALTLFKTVPQQQYNMLRQVKGEAEHYKQEYKNGNISKTEYTQAKKKVGRSVLGIIIAGLGIEAINFLNALLKNRAKRYRDDDGKLAWESAGKQFLEGFASDNLGMIIGGDLTVEILGSVALGDNWYGIETPGITQIEDILEEFIGACRGIGELVQDGYKILANGGDLGEYLRRHGADYLGGLKDALATVATYFGGVAMNNIEGYTLGALSWIAPELKIAYEDWFATADKSGLVGLTGDALETRVSDILENRLGSAEEETASALAGLYEAGYKTAIPTDTPNKVSVGGEDQKLNAYQQQFYDTVWQEAIGDSLDELVNSKEFQGADAETQAKMAAKLYSYAAEKAKAALFEDFSESTWVTELDTAVNGGESAAEWIAWYVLSSGVSEKVVTALTDAGMGKEDALELAKEYQAATKGLTSDKDENGDTIPGSKRKKVLDAIDTLKISAAQKTALYYAAGYSASTLKDAPWYYDIMLPG